ncbi:hypothetical protein [Blautia sp.]|uniref:hypothetical protein n=1 Tax=Blautia sp. TaxID=1955243 RepID=UPI0026256465|nr:hypothetical protein [Blautia sp.]
MAKYKKIIVTISLTSMILGIASVAYAKDEKVISDVYDKIEFNNFSNSDGTLNLDTYNLNTLRSTNDLMLIETKSGELKSFEDGKINAMNMISFENGVATYDLESNLDSSNQENVQLTYPVFYVEEQNINKMTFSIADESDLINATVSDSKEKFPDADRGVLVEFTYEDIEKLPYNMALVSGGKKYEDCAVSYYFDIKTGDFTHGYLIYFGITMEELKPDATLEASSMLNRCSPTEFNFAN